MGNPSRTAAIKFTEPPCLVADITAEQAFRPALNWRSPPHTLCGSRFNLTFVPRTKRNPHLDWLTKISTSAAQYLCGVFRCVPLMFLLKRKQNSLCFGISWLVLRVQLCPGAHAVRGEAQFIPPSHPMDPWGRVVACGSVRETKCICTVGMEASDNICSTRWGSSVSYPTRLTKPQFLFRAVGIFLMSTFFLINC